MEVTFQPVIKVLDTFQPTYSIEQLAQETGVYPASPDFVRHTCGPIANRILDLVPEDFYQECQALGLLPNIDVRVHRLYPGDFPAYPGWHCDGEFRGDYHSQPELDKVATHRHLVATASTDEQGVSNTLFVNQPFHFTADEIPSSDNTLWGQVHTAIESEERELWQAKDGQLVEFDSWTLHKTAPARIRGWRLFFRMSMWHRPYLGDEGMISRQEQVYKLAEGSGW